MLRRSIVFRRHVRTERATKPEKAIYPVTAPTSTVATRMAPINSKKGKGGGGKAAAATSSNHASKKRASPGTSAASTSHKSSPNKDGSAQSSSTTKAATADSDLPTPAYLVSCDIPTKQYIQYLNEQIVGGPDKKFILQDLDATRLLIKPSAQAEIDRKLDIWFDENIFSAIEKVGEDFDVS